MKGKKGRQNQPDVPVVLDCCGVDINDPIGTHTVNFTFHLEANEDPEKPFEGDIDLALPHNLPKSVKPPKIELTKPSTDWKTTFPVIIDDNFINQIKEKRFIYKLTFLFKTGQHGKNAPKMPPRRGNDKNAPPPIVNQTFFVDVSCLLIRGGRFKPFLSYKTSCQPQGFEKFEFSVSIDYPILSDAQIRRFQPFACFLKGVHQLPNTPISFEELAKNCIGPHIFIKYGQNPPLVSYPQKHGPELKLNIAYMLWAPTEKELVVELHDREVEMPPDLNAVVGSAYIIPPDPNKKQTEPDPLSIEQILGVKKEASVRPYGTVSFYLQPGRKLLPFKPVATRDSLIKPGFYVENGTYITVEMENMKDTVPVLPPPPIPVVTPRSKRPTTSSSARKQAAQQPVVEKPPYFFNRCVITCDLSEMSDLEKSQANQIQERIVISNAQTFQTKDIAAVPSMKVQSDDSDAISGFILIDEDKQIMVLEVLENSENANQLKSFFETINSPHIKIIKDFESHFPSPRLYGTFDCAVKKFKLNKPLDEMLLEPDIYVRNSHMSNCFTVLNQLNHLRKFDPSENFADLTILQFWPKAEELENLNAKRGVLLTMEELCFPPRPPRNDSDLNQNNENKDNSDSLPGPFVYTPISDESNASEPHDVNYFINRNLDYIKTLEKKHTHQRGLVETTEDGEVEIWNLKKGTPPPITNQKGKSGIVTWKDESPDAKFVSLSQATGMDYFTKNLRKEDPNEFAEKGRFYSYKSSVTFLPPIEQLKANVNNEPWTNGDLSLASADSRFVNDTRAPIYTNYNPCVRTHGESNFTYFSPLYIDEEYKPRKLPGQNDRTYVSKPYQHHLGRFSAVLPQFTKDMNILLGHPDPTPISIQEEYHDPLIASKEHSDLKPGQKRFRTVFPDMPVLKGSTDSNTVKNITFTFPPVKPGF